MDQAYYANPMVLMLVPFSFASFYSYWLLSCSHESALSLISFGQAKENEEKLG